VGFEAEDGSVLQGEDEGGAAVVFLTEGGVGVGCEVDGGGDSDDDDEVGEFVDVFVEVDQVEGVESVYEFGVGDVSVAVL
jgi:hypothetical protein